MFIRSLFFAFTTLIFVSAAHAEDEGAQATSAGPDNSVGSEYLHQAAGGRFELSPGTGILSVGRKFKGTTDKSTRTLIPFLVKGEYGFSDMFSLSAQLGLGIGAVDNSCMAPAICSDTVQSGMIDPVLSANARIPLGIMALRFGADLSASMGKAKIEKDGDSNLASGGAALAPYFGIDFALADMIFGFKLSYDLYKGEREVQDDSGTPNSYKFTGGQDLEADFFYEFNFPKIVTLGGAIAYIDSTNTKTKVSGTTTANKDSSSTYDLKVYVPLHFTPRVTLVPSVSVGATDFRSSTVTVKEQTNTTVNVFARFTF